MKASAFAILVLVLAPAAAAARPAPNVIIVSLDTTRFDHLGVGGLSLPTSPVLDRLARDSYVFTRAQSVIPLTGPAHATLMTGLYPHTSGAVRNTTPVRDDVTTLAEVLRADGYATAAFVSGWTLRSALCRLNRGFDVYDEEMSDRYKVVRMYRPSEQTTDRALTWLARRDNPTQPFFLFVHYFDAHDPYEERQPWSSGFLSDYWARRKSVDPKTARKLSGYDSEIAFTDRQLGRLIGALQDSHALDASWLIVLSDHGEAFGENGYQHHGRRVHEPAMHIALVIRPPGGLQVARWIDARVSQIDVLPSLLELLGHNPLPVQGTSMVPLFEGRDVPRPPVRFETFNLWSLRRKKLPSKLGLYDGTMKIVLSPRDDDFEVYDLARDPQERSNVAAKYPNLEHYRRGLMDWWRASKSRIEEPDLSAEDLERLRQLGYAN